MGLEFVSGHLGVVKGKLGQSHVGRDSFGLGKVFGGRGGEVPLVFGRCLLVFGRCLVAEEVRFGWLVSGRCLMLVFGSWCLM